MKRLFLFLFAAILGISQVWGAYTCTVQAYPEGKGFVGTSTNPTAGSTTATGSYSYSTVDVYAKAAQNSGYVFVGWATSTSPSSYLSTSTTNTCKYNFKPSDYNNKTIYAIFKPEAKSVTIYQAGTSEGTTTWASGTIPSDVVDMGLPSGVFWRTSDLDGYYKWGTNASTTSYGSSGFTYSQTWTNLPTALGSGYRIPTKEEYEELINTSYCSVSTSNYATTITSKTTNKSLTFSKQGYYPSSTKTNSPTHYWTSTYASGTSASAAKAYALKVGQTQTGAPYTSDIYEYYACKIRPVYDAPYKTLTINVGTYKYIYKCVPGQEVTVTPSATSGNNFTGWTGDYTGSDKPHTFTVSSNITVTANFATAGYAVTIDDDGNGTATATANNGTLASTSSVNLSATPNEGYEFLKWTLKTTGSEVDQTWVQNPTNVSITAACTIKAYFKLKQYKISASVDQSCTGMGSVTGGGDYNHGATVTLTPTAEPGYHFEKWSDNATSNPYKFTATANKTVTAYFAPNATTYNITVTKNIDVAGTATVENGTGVTASTPATLTATANSGYRFVKWTSNAVDYTANPLNVKVSTDAEYQAVFEALALREDVIYQDLARNGHDNDFTFGNTSYYTLTIIGNGKNTYKCLPGQQVKITVANEADWAFQKWSDENTYNPRTFTVSADATVRAIFVSSPGNPSSEPVIPIPLCDNKIYQDNNSNGTTKSYATPASYSADYVDLGLSVLWGTSNVTNGGQGFFSWGDPKDQKEEYTTGTWSGESKDIVNTIKGGDWRMPTRAEFDELFANCTWSKSGTNYVGTSKTNSYATITLQARGYKYNKTTSATDWLYYWTGDNSNETEAYPVKTSAFPPERPNNDDGKYLGMSVRGVYPAPTTRYILTVKSQNGTTIGAKVNRFIVDSDHNTVIIYAQPKADGSRFVKWSDGNTENPRTFTVTANAEITAEFIPYTGVISGTEWGTASNWGNNIMPNANCNVTLSSNVTIGSAIDNTNIFQVFAKANSLIINAGNTLTVKSGAVLDVKSLTNNGTLIIEQDAILNVTGTLNNYGVMTTEDLNMAAINHLDIQPGAVVYVNGAVIGSTAANLTIMADATKMATLYLASTSLVQPTATVQNYTVAKKVEETYTWQHYGIPTVSAPTMNAPATTYYYGWDNMNGWTKGEQSMVTTPFIGYNMTNEEAAASTVSFAGQLVGNKATTATLSRGWNFLANSYTTPVSTAAIINNLPEGAEQTICMYDPCYRGDANMRYVSATDVSDGTADVATLLPMQTYFVEVKATAGAINMDYVDIAINPTENTPASAPVRMNTPNYTGRVFINVESTMGSDVVKLRESADFSTAWDNGADASKMGKVVNSAPLLYVAAATRQAQLATDNLVGTVLGLEAGNTTDYTLTFSGLQGQTYILRDLATGVETEMTEDAQYHFSAEKGSVNAARFAIVGARKVTTDMGNTTQNQHNSKMIENGQVVIVRDGARFNVLGVEMK